MQIYFNDTSMECSDSESFVAALSRYCQLAALDLDSVAVAAGNQVVPRSQWSQIEVATHSRYAVFSAVAGG